MDLQIYFFSSPVAPYETKELKKKTLANINVTRQTMESFEIRPIKRIFYKNPIWEDLIDLKVFFMWYVYICHSTIHYNLAVASM